MPAHRCPDTIPAWVHDNLTTPGGDVDAPQGLDDLWPEDVLSEAEWDAAWADRQAIRASQEGR